MTLPPATTPRDATRLVRSFNHYEILAELGSGGMATVFLGRAHGVAGFERLVAVKRCHPHLREDKTFVTMFLEEARLAARIRHPNVVATFDVFDEDAPCLVMEYVEGDAFSKLLRECERTAVRLPVPIALRVMVDTLTGLQAAHDLVGDDGSPLNLVHRDISPQNILLGVDGIARLTDFGIAKAESRVAVTSEGRVRGKLAYMAPEQLESRLASRRSDVFAAGVVLWEALTGRRLYEAETDRELVDLVLRAAVTRPSRIAPGVPPSLDAVVLKALDANADARFASAADFADALEHCAPLATNRSMSTYVSTAFGEIVSRRRDAVRSRTSLPPVPRDGTPTEASTVQSVRPPSAASRRVSYAALGAAFLAAIVGLGFGAMFYRGRHDTRAIAPPASSVPTAPPIAQAPASAPATEASAPVVAPASEAIDNGASAPAQHPSRATTAHHATRTMRHARSVGRSRTTTGVHRTSPAAPALPAFREL